MTTRKLEIDDAVGGAVQKLCVVARRLASIFLVLLVMPAWADGALHGRVVGVAGGDALTLIDAHHREHKLRLAYIDAPELGQTFGDEAQSALAAMVLNREVIADIKTRGDDGSMQAEVSSPSGQIVNLELVRSGLAWHSYFGRQSAAEREHYSSASTQAQRERRGMWALDQLESPPDYRARTGRALRWWLYVVAACAAIAALAGTYAKFGARAEAWLAKQAELEKSRTENYRLAQIASEAEAAERERTREIANREMNRLAVEHRTREKASGIEAVQLGLGDS